MTSQTTEFPGVPPVRDVSPRVFQSASDVVDRAEYNHLRGLRVGLVVLSPFPWDPRPLRATTALAQQGMHVDVVCVTDGEPAWGEKIDGINVIWVPITRHRGGRLMYVYEYAAFTLAATLIFAVLSLRRKYDLIYVNNMPDILVVSALLPKLLGSKVILDLHDPMPELISTIFGKAETSLSCRAVKWLEKWSIARANEIISPNIACQRVFGSRSCPAEKITVVMNTPDDVIFPFRPVSACPIQSQDPKRPFIVMYHGSLLERNGANLAVEAFALIRDKVPNAELHIYGKGTPFLEKVKQSVRELGLEDRVRYLGQQTQAEIAEAILTCDIGVIPNQRNAFAEINTPTRIFEYLALGKPVIAPRTPGIQDYFSEDSLFFFEVGSAEELAKKIEYVASHPIETRKITERGQHVYTEHMWKHERAILVDLVSKLLRS
jgi:glycosyltransferase involved in cell wall biosynthesis